MYLNAPGIRIHGTYDTSSIGTHASHGCIRMLIPDVEQLYPLVPIGTRVIVF
jgi:lipoprotein-anchoring transpeptidase ErfK/SrfK